MIEFRNILNKLKTPYYRSLIDSKYGVGALEKFIFSNWINPILTLWLNFRSLSLMHAIRLPIWVYGRPRLYCLSGKIIIKDKIKPGMIKFNKVNFGAPGNMTKQSELYNLGRIIFNGKCEIGTGNKIIVNYSPNLVFGDNCKIMDNCIIAVHEGVKIGSGSIISNNCQILDTNFHFLADLNTQKIRKRSNAISIGSNCWICNSSSIMMGTHIPDYTVVGSHSLVNGKFFNEEGKVGGIIAGSPAKLKRSNIIRVFNSEVEKKIWKYWKNNFTDYYPIEDLDIEELSTYK